ncbi:MAG: ligase-associated DNA damage response exonuclease [Bacteroidota bacterium]|nr:ligase-associated DNA damage response exonuclease [Bacteroidota bacterium]
MHPIRRHPLLEFNSNGIYCAQADVYIDPWRKVGRALITHAHADHARYGMKHYLTTPGSALIMRERIGQSLSIETTEYGQKHTIGGVTFSFHPAGHVLGSAMIRVEYKGEVWVASGDYKIGHDSFGNHFEPIPCHTFITESTFGLPVFRWEKENQVFDAINTWWKKNQSMGYTSIVYAYSLGKAQRVLQGIDPNIGPVVCHAAVQKLNRAIHDAGYSIHSTSSFTEWKDSPKEVLPLIIAPPASADGPWMKNHKPYVTAIASGWMALRGNRRRRNVDRGFVLSDHADWKGLLFAIEQSQANQVLVTHGYSQIFSQYLEEQGWDARVAETAFSDGFHEVEENQVSE